MRESSSHTMYHASRVTFHMSPVTCNMSPVNVKKNYIKKKRKKLEKNGQSGGASRWRVCYQRGLPRLVYFVFDKRIIWLLVYYWTNLLCQGEQECYLQTYKRSTRTFRCLLYNYARFESEVISSSS